MHCEWEIKIKVTQYRLLLIIDMVTKAGNYLIDVVPKAGLTVIFENLPFSS